MDPLPAWCRGDEGLLCHEPTSLGDVVSSHDRVHSTSAGVLAILCDSMSLAECLAPMDSRAGSVAWSQADGADSRIPVPAVPGPGSTLGGFPFQSFLYCLVFFPPVISVDVVGVQNAESFYSVDGSGAGIFPAQLVDDGIFLFP